MPSFRTPHFQAQNPAINGYALGWASCTAYSAAMAAAFDRQVPIVMSGESVRRRTGDTSGGLRLAQVDAALNSGWNINLSVYYRLPWATFAKLIDSGMGGILQGWYAPIADSRFDAGRGFRGNHAVFVPPDWAAMDPLADGRFGQAYRYKGEAYPKSLLRSFAGKLNLATSGYRALGDGYVYCAMTRDRVHSYRLRFRGGAFWVYHIGPDGRIASRYARSFSKTTQADCTVPKSDAWPGHGNRTLVRVTSGTALKGDYIAVPQGTLELEVVP
jgi:hypothetical protein